MGITVPNLFGSLSASGQGDLVSEAQCCSCHQLTLSHNVVSSWSFTLFISLLNVLWRQTKDRASAEPQMTSSPGFLWPQSPSVNQGVPSAPPRGPRELTVSRAWTGRQGGSPCCRKGVGRVLSSGIQGKGRRERKTSSKQSAWLRTFPSSGTSPRWDGLSQMDSPYCHTHIPASTFINTSHCQSRSSTSRLEVEQLSLRVQAPQLSVTRAADPWAEVLNHTLSSPRINSEASGCVDLNHQGQGAGWSRGSDFPGRASGLYISSGGLGTQIFPPATAAREEPSEQLLLSTHHVPGRRAQHRRVGAVGSRDGGGQLDTIISGSCVLI